MMFSKAIGASAAITSKTSHYSFGIWVYESMSLVDHLKQLICNPPLFDGWDSEPSKSLKSAKDKIEVHHSSLKDEQAEKAGFVEDSLTLWLAKKMLGTWKWMVGIWNNY